MKNETVFNRSFSELCGRDRAKKILDRGTFRELVGPFDHMESPYLQEQHIIPQKDDGVIVAKGTIDNHPVVIFSIEGKFQGGGIGEVSGSKISGALELALQDIKNGIPIQPIFLLDSGGIRLQEANQGLLAIAEIQSAIVEIRHYTPVTGIIPGKIGSFGGMSITAGLFSNIIMTREGRIGLNGPEVVELEAGIEEFDSSNRPLIWRTIGGKQRVKIDVADILVEDDINDIKKSLKEVMYINKHSKARFNQINDSLNFLKTIDFTQQLTPESLQKIIKEWKKRDNIKDKVRKDNRIIDLKNCQSRGAVWFAALTNLTTVQTDTPSVLCHDDYIDNHLVRYISVIPNPNSSFPRARAGETGIEEGWAIAKYVKEAINKDKGYKPRTIVAIVDVPGQAYGYKEELLGIHQSLAASTNAYVEARIAGHPVVTLVVGKAISGSFIAHGLQANRLLAFDNENVNVHVMSKSAISRVTGKTVQLLEETSKNIPCTAYDIQSFYSLGSIDQLIQNINPDSPSQDDIRKIKNIIFENIVDIREKPVDLSRRLTSRQGLQSRKASIKVRKKLKEQWN